jgi:2-methylcitrate dehydratase PrpD
MNVTRAACAFIESSRYEKLPPEAVRISRRCILDGLALYVSGSAEDSVKILVAEALDIGGREDALLLGAGARKVPAPIAARVLGTAGLPWVGRYSGVARSARHRPVDPSHDPPLTAAWC